MVKISTKCSTLAGILLCMCLSLARNALAEVRVEVNPRSGAINEQFVMSVIIESEDDAGVPQLSRSDDFNAIYIGPQSSVSIVNGHVSKSMAFSYRLVPRREGLLETPAIDIEVGSHSQHLDPVKVKVSAAQDVPADKINGVYLKQSIDPKTVYLGQQADNVIELQTAINLIDPQFADTSFDGFWSESIADNERSSRVSGGYQYDILRFRKALYALKTGSLVIPPKRLKTKIREQRRNRPSPFDGLNPFDGGIFDDFFGGGSLKEVVVESNPLTVEVKPLPPAPENFPTLGLLNPIVGETTLSAAIPNGDLQLGETKTIEFTLLSTGNLNPLKSLRVAAPPTVKIYEDAPESKTFESGGTLMSKKTFRVSLVPMQSGDLTVPGVQLGYFDTSSDSYRIARTQDVVLHVLPGEINNLSGNTAQAKVEQQPQATAAAPTAPKESLPQSGNSMRYEPEGTVSKLTKQISVSMALLILCAVLLLIWASWIIATTSKRDLPYRQLKADLERSQTLSELNHSFQNMLAFKLKLNSSEQRGDQLRAALEKRLGDKDLVFAVQSLLDDLDRSLYGQHTQDFELLKGRALSYAAKL